MSNITNIEQWITLLIAIAAICAVLGIGAYIADTFLGD